MHRFVVLCIHGLVSWMLVSYFFPNLSEVFLVASQKLIESAKLGNEDEMRKLISTGVSVDEVDSSGTPALHYCVKRGSIGCVRLLLNSKASVDLVNKNEETALYIASKKGNLPLAKLLISAGADVDKGSGPFKYTPLFGAIISNSAPIVDELVAEGADVNAKASTSETPVWVAAFLGNQDSVQILAKNGANVLVEAYSYLPKEVLCRCLTADYFGDACNMKACASRATMKKLLS